MANESPSFLRRLMMNSGLMDMDGLEDRMVAMPNVHHWVDGSPVRFEIMKEGLKRGGSTRSIWGTGSLPAHIPMCRPNCILGAGMYC